MVVSLLLNVKSLKCVLDKTQTDLYRSGPKKDVDETKRCGHMLGRNIWRWISVNLEDTTGSVE